MVLLSAIKNAEAWTIKYGRGKCSMLRSIQIRQVFALDVTIRTASSSTLIRNQGKILRKQAPMALGWCFLNYHYHYYQSTTLMSTLCDSGFADTRASEFALKRYQEQKNKTHTTLLSIRQKFYRYWRMLKRMIQLAITLSPILAFYPIFLLAASAKNKDESKSKDVHTIVVSASPAFDFTNDSCKQDKIFKGIVGWYYRLCLACVESSGACVIKLMQWAGSRPDMFGAEFCNIFSKLQDNTNPHSWKHTEKLLCDAFGTDWHTRIRIDEAILGSGCIGQVYRGKVMKQQTISTDNNEVEWQEAAIKVLHPNVQYDVEADLDLMRMFVKQIQYMPFVFSNLRWLNLEGIVEELARLLSLQMDLRLEAHNLKMFQRNFSANDRIVFPSLIDGYEPTPNVLVEEFCTGIPIVQFCRNNYMTQPEKLKELCSIAIHGVCQMIFLDNFVHGDLHPGNVFISPDGKKFILFDVGIVNEYSDADHQLIVDVLAAFIRKDGKRAGRLMIDDSNSKLWALSEKDRAVNEQEYIDKIEALTIRARTKGYLMEHLGTYITYMCNAASKHHVMINPAFISAALAVKVQEGIALALDPSMQIPPIAIPIIMESERRRLKQAAKTQLLSSIQKFKEQLALLDTGKDNS